MGKKMKQKGLMKLKKLIHYEKLNKIQYKLPASFIASNKTCRIMPKSFSIKAVTQKYPTRQRKCQSFLLECESCHKPLLRIQEGSYTDKKPLVFNVSWPCNLPSDGILRFSLRPTKNYTLCRIFYVEIMLLIFQED